MFRKGQSYTLHPSYTRHPNYPRHPTYTRFPSNTRDPRQHHDPTWGTQSAATESALRDSPGELHLPPPATPSANYLLTIRSCHTERQLLAQDTVLPHRAPTTCPRYGTATPSANYLITIRSNCTRRHKWVYVLMSSIASNQRASRLGNQYSCNLDQESKCTNPGIVTKEIPIRKLSPRQRLSSPRWCKWLALWPVEHAVKVSRPQCQSPSVIHTLPWSVS